MRPRAWASAFVAALLALTLVPMPLAASAADPTAILTVVKTASTSTVAPGEHFAYELMVTCSTIGVDGCNDAQLTDVVPDEFELISVAVDGDLGTAEPVSGQTATVNFTQSLGDGGTGLENGLTTTITLNVKARDDLPYEVNGIAVTNTADFTATNATSVSDSADVTPVVPLVLDTAATKSLDPASAIANVGTPVKATLGGSNASNATVDALVIQDPVDTAAAGNPFEFLGFTGFGTVTPPSGATDTTYEVYVAGAWVAASGGSLPSGTDPGDVRGTRVTFTGAIPAGATASVVVDTAHTQAAVDAGDNYTVTNSVSSTVQLGTADASDTANATHTLMESRVQVDASKVFAPDVVLPGDTSTVTLGATNHSAAALDTLTVREPATGAFDPLIVFDGITGPVQFPAGADAATLTYYVGVDEYQVPLVEGETPDLPDGVDAADITAFQIAFSGTIAPGDEAEIVFDVIAGATTGTDPVDVANKIGVVGESNAGSANAEAEDLLHIYQPQLETWIKKQIRPGEIVAVPGETTLVSLTGGTSGRPDPDNGVTTGSTAYADQVVLQDPVAVPAAAGEWWDAFDVTSITQTPIPSGAELQISYYDTVTGGWVELGGPLAGPQVHSQQLSDALSERIGGLQFVYTYTGTDDGFAPGTTFAPNFTSELRSESRADAPAPAFDAVNGGVIPNCAASNGTIDLTAGGPDAETAQTGDECSEITLVPADGTGTGDMIDKLYGTSSSNGVKSVIERSGDTIPATLSWSTGGRTFESVEIADVADPASTPIADSVFDAFNLVRIDPITAAKDPLLTYDAVSAVLLYNGTAWVEAADDPCPDLCDGTFPGYTLTDAERASTVGVKLVFVESPTRADRIVGDLDAPQVGTGVARSNTNARQINVVFEVRDARRDTATPGPVLASGAFNIPGSTGQVRNTVGATGTPFVGDAVEQRDSDTVNITHVPLTIESTKTWSGSPLAVPAPGTPIEHYPTSRVTLTATNTTPARVDLMTITDPAPDSADNPFDKFNLVGFTNITLPAGADSGETKVWLTGLSDVVPFSRTEALSLTEDQLKLVTGIKIEFGGRIDSAATGSIAFDMRLRADERGSSPAVPVVPQDEPIINQQLSTISDLGGDDGRLAEDLSDAPIQLAAPSLAVDTTKTIAPASQKEGDRSPVTVTLTAQPAETSSARTTKITITDDDWSFFNAFDFAGISPDFALTNPIDNVTIYTYSGGSVSDTGVSGGDWHKVVSNGTAADALAWSNGLSDTARAVIQGVRFEFESGNGKQWQNSARPLQTVPFTVVRRTELRSGGAVPSTNPTNEAAPGETSPGVYGNDIDTASISVPVDADGNRLSATDTDAASYVYLAKSTEVEVDKTPTGVMAPGAKIPFKITFTNTGETDIHEPIFTDYIPTDADGAMLIFDPDADPTATPYTFSLTGPAPTETGYVSIPTTVDDIDVTFASDGTKLAFAMPDGTAFGQGQTFTVSIPMMFRPGVEAGTPVTNRGSISATDPEQNFSLCNGVVSSPTAEPIYECSDETTVTPQVLPALSTRKFVRADEPAHAPENERDDYVCTQDDADADGFRTPCIPVSTPGTEATWRFRTVNSGTLPINQVVAIDHLPTIGDTGVLITQLARGSQWTTEFAGGVQLADAPAGAVLTTYYSTSDTPCTADLDTSGTPCATGDWVPAADIADLSTVRSIKFVVDFTQGLFVPGAAIAMELKTLTPAFLDPAQSYPVAWNTVAVGGRALNAGSEVAVAPNEGRRVGLSFPVGSLKVIKTLSGDGTDFAPDTFSGVQVVCTSAGETVTGLPSLTLTEGVSQQVDNIPYGASCTVSEADHGQVSADAGTVTISGAHDPTPVVPLITLDNEYLLGGFEVTKTVDNGGAIDQDGTSISYPRDFVFTAQCTFLGDEVLDEDFTLADGDSRTFDDLPAGADCTVVETDDQLADSTTVQVTEDGTAGTAATASDTTFSLLPYETGETQALTTAAFTNHYLTGAVQVTKQITGSGASWGDADFTLAMTCRLPDAMPNPVYDGTGVVNAASPVWTVQNLPTGAVCDITETADGGANSSSGGVTVTVGDDPAQPTTATVTNTFTVGSITVEKALTGSPAAGLEPATTFEYEVTLVCTREVNGDTVAVSIPGGATRTVIGAGSVTYTDLPTGASCIVTESDTGHATSHTISAGAVTVGDGPAADPIIVTNDFANGQVSVTKTVTAPAGFPVPSSFTAHLVCTWNGADVPLADDGEITITDGQTVTVSDIPVGSACVVTEDDALQGESTITPASATITAAGSTSAVDIENVYEWAALRVSKTVEAATADFPTAFGFHAVCTYDGSTVLDEEFTLNADEHRDFDTLPARAECEVTETDARGADDTVTTATVAGAAGALAPQIDQDARTVVIPELAPGTVADASNSVSYANLYERAAFVVSKTLAGEGAAQFGADKTFTVTVVCTFEGEELTRTQLALNAENGWTAGVADVIAGAECTVVEDTLQGADAVVITPNDGADTTTGVIEIPDTGAAEVEVTNWYLTGSVEVTKTFAGAGSEKYGTGDFEVQLICLRDGITVDIPGDALRTVNASSPTVRYEHLPTGADCTLTETQAGGANSTAILDADGVELAGSAEDGYTFTVQTDPSVLAVTDQTQPGLQVQNTFNLAEVSVSKTVETTAVGVDDEPVPYGPFEVQLVCTYDGASVTAAEGMTQVIADGETFTWTELPQGAVCNVTETDAADAEYTTITVNDADPITDTTVALDALPAANADDQVTVALTNVYGVASLSIGKVVDGSAAGDVTRTFPVRVICALVDASHPAPGLVVLDDTFQIGGSDRLTAQRDNLPTGADCAVTEVDAGGADRTSITISGETTPGTEGSVTLASGSTSITFTNTFMKPLAITGGGVAWIAGGLGVLLFGGGFLVLLFTRRRRRLEA